MALFANVFWIGTMVTTCLLQTIGFFSPEWACNIDKSNYTSSNDSCEIKGLFYPSGIQDMDIFVLCISCLVVSLICTVVMLLRFTKIFDECCVYVDEPHETIASIIFLIFQFLAGVANVICFVRYDVMGWSAIIFVTFGCPVFVLVVVVILLYCLYIYMKSPVSDVIDPEDVFTITTSG